LVRRDGNKQKTIFYSEVGYEFDPAHRFEIWVPNWALNEQKVGAPLFAASSIKSPRRLLGLALPSTSTEGSGRRGTRYLRIDDPKIRAWVQEETDRPKDF